MLPLVNTSFSLELVSQVATKTDIQSFAAFTASLYLDGGLTELE